LLPLLGPIVALIRMLKLLVLALALIRLVVAVLQHGPAFFMGE